MQRRAFCQHQEARCGLGGGEEAPQRMLEEQSEEPRRDRAQDQQPAEPRVGVVRVDVAIPQRAAQAPDDPHPVLEEEEQQHDRGGDVRRDEEAEDREDLSRDILKVIYSHRPILTRRLICFCI